MTRVEVRKSGEVDVQSGFRELRLCKTTQSGYEGFHRDQYTLLPDTKERLMGAPGRSQEHSKSAPRESRKCPNTTEPPSR